MYHVANAISCVISISSTIILLLIGANTDCFCFSSDFVKRFLGKDCAELKIGYPRDAFIFTHHNIARFFLP